MNSAQTGPANDDDDCYDVTVNSAAANLDVLKKERLAYTEIPVKKTRPEQRSTRKSALLEAMYYWVSSRF